MPGLARVLRDGAILTIPGAVYLIALLRYNPRLILNKGDVPADILAAVPPKTQEEQRQAMVLSLPFFIWSLGVPLASTLALSRERQSQASYWHLFLHALGVLSVFNLVDLVVLDWLIVCTITPDFLVYPGTKGMAGYKDKRFHLGAHRRGLPLMLVPALLIAAIAKLVGNR